MRKQDLQKICRHAMQNRQGNNYTCILCGKKSSGRPVQDPEEGISICEVSSSQTGSEIIHTLINKETVAAQTQKDVLTKILSVVDDQIRLTDYTCYIIMIEIIKKINNGDLVSLRHGQNEMKAGIE